MIESLHAPIRALAEAGWLPAAFAQVWMARAMLACLLMAPLLGGLSPLVVSKRLAFFSAALGHGALTGVALGLLLGEPLEAPYVGTFGFCLLLALAATYVIHNAGLPSDTVVGVFLAFTLGLGICLLVVVVQRFDVHQVEAVLFGSVITVSDTDLAVLIGVGAVALVVLAPIYNQLLLAALDPALARSRGVAVTRNEYLFMLTLTLVIVASIKIIGAMMVEALVIVPAAAARNLVGGARGYVVASGLVALIGTQAGLFAATKVEVPAGAAIVLALGIAFFVCFGVGRAWTRLGRRG